MSDRAVTETTKITSAENERESFREKLLRSVKMKMVEHKAEIATGIFVALTTRPDQPALGFTPESLQSFLGMSGMGYLVATAIDSIVFRSSSGEKSVATKLLVGNATEKTEAMVRLGLGYSGALIGGLLASYEMHTGTVTRPMLATLAEVICNMLNAFNTSYSSLQESMKTGSSEAGEQMSKMFSDFVQSVQNYPGWALQGVEENLSNPEYVKQDIQFLIGMLALVLGIRYRKTAGEGGSLLFHFLSWAGNNTKDGLVRLYNKINSYELKLRSPIQNPFVVTAKQREDATVQTAPGD